MRGFRRAVARRVNARAERRERAWSEAAERLGLSISGTRGARGPMSGAIEGLLTTIERARTGPDVRVRVDARGSIPRDVSITLVRSRLLRGETGGERVFTRDRRFDFEAWVEGHEVRVVALLGPRARQVVLAGLERWPDTAIADGLILSDASDADHPDLLVERAKALLSIARSISLDGRTVPERLLDTALEESDRGPRINALRLLFEQFGEAGARRALARAIERSDAELRVYAAQRLPDSEAIREFREVLEAHDASEEVHCRALRGLLLRESGLPALRLIAVALESGTDGMRRVAVETWFERHRTDAEIESLIDAAATTPAELALLASAICRLPDEPASNRLRERIRIRLVRAEGALSLAGLELDAIGRVSKAPLSGAVSFVRPTDRAQRG